MDPDLKPKSRISIKAVLNNVIPDLSQIDVPTVQIYVAVLIAVITVLYVIFRIVRGRSKKYVVAILGLCESGKTQLFSRLCFGVDVVSVTSVKESSGYFNLVNNEKLLMYDLPGHERIRYVLFEKVKQQAKALLFVIDAATIQQDLKDVAEFLYTVLCDGSIQNGHTQMLVVCNKQDLPTAKGINIIKSSLEKEMNLLRITKAKQLKAVGEGENNNSFLGFHGQDFEFSHLKPVKVTFVEAVAKGGKQLSTIKKWLNSI